jgi:hypothetical protein
VSQNDPKIEDVLREVLDSERRDLHTALPGRVESYDAAKQTANVSLQVLHVGKDENGNPVQSKYPVLANVPVAFPRGGGFFLSFPLVKGDHVFVVFCEASIDQWRAKGAETYPGDLRRHGLTGAVAIPCLYPRTKPLANAGSANLTLGAAGVPGAAPVIQVTPTEVLLGSEAAVAAVALAPLVNAQLIALKAAITATVIVPADGGASFKSTLLAALSAWPATVAATKVKAI